MKLGIMNDFPMFEPTERDICLICFGIGWKDCKSKADYYVHHKCAEDEIRVLSHKLRNEKVEPDSDMSNKIFNKYEFHINGVEFARQKLVNNK